MLKITVDDNEHQRTLVLEGTLVEPWVVELERAWAEAQRLNGGRTVVVALKDVTAISRDGEDLLFQMMSGGAKFLCCRGVLIKHVLQQLELRSAVQPEKVGISCD
jgi:hypothetical protein